MEGGARDVVLNVREDNTAAIGAYTRLGFTVHEPFWEGYATPRTEPRRLTWRRQRE